MKSKDKEFVFRWGRKLKAVCYKGGKCSQCNKNLKNRPWIAVFHHSNPAQKEWAPSELMNQKDWTVVANELDKCELICKNCHGILHMNIEKYNSLKEDILKIANDPLSMRTVYARKSTKEEKKRATELFEKGLTYEEISALLQFQGSTIRGWCPKNKNLDFNDLQSEQRIIDLYETKQLPMKDICIILRCSFRKLRKKVLELIERRLIKEYRKPNHNQYSKNPNNVVINNRRYQSMREASLIEKINYTTLRGRVKSNSEKWKQYRYVHGSLKSSSS